MKVASVQMVSTPRVDDNLQAAARLIAQAAQGGAELVVLPEYFCLMGQRDSDKLAIQESDGHGPLQTFLAQQAQQHGVFLAGGTLPLQSSQPERVRNSLLVYTPEGLRAARYDKIHLFSFHKGREAYNEAHTLEAGTQPVAFELRSRSGEVWRVGLSVCYDLRFAELYRQLDADLILVPAAFTHTTGQAHWEVLLRARAIENQAYALASGQGGTHENGRATWGQSMVIDPWGEVLAQQATGEGVVMATLERERLEHVRTVLPVRRHRVL